VFIQINTLFYFRDTMFLENITFSISKNISQDFERWIKPELQDIEIWVETIHTYKLLTEIDPQSCNYSIQFSFVSKEQHEIFKQLHFDTLLAKTQINFEGEVLYFNTLLQKF
jgi:hypothetical protein